MVKLPVLPEGYFWEIDKNFVLSMAFDGGVCALRIKRRVAKKFLGVSYQKKITCAYAVTFGDKKWVEDEAAVMVENLFVCP